MPHQTCTICRHPDLEAINSDRGSVRKVTKRFGVSPAALDRHRHHADHATNRVNSGQIAQIDDEIRRLKRAQTAARKRRDSAAFVRLSGELRQWHTLKSKLLGSMLPEKEAPEPAVSPRDALQMAEAIIEMNLAGDQRQQVAEWLTGLLERVRPPNAALSNAYGTEEPSENSDNSVTVGTDTCKSFQE